MLKVWQLAPLTLLGAAMWALVTFNISRHPEAALEPKSVPAMLAMAPIVGFVSVWLCKFVGRLSPEQILPGVAVVGAVAMLMDGVALRWYAEIYAGSEKALRLSAADLLWGYGVGFVAALVWRWLAVARETSPTR